jgi:hypothetical protein
MQQPMRAAVAAFLLCSQAPPVSAADGAGSFVRIGAGKARTYDSPERYDNGSRLGVEITGGHRWRYRTAGSLQPPRGRAPKAVSVGLEFRY